MIKKCLLAAAVTAAALLCLTGCQPKKDPLQFGSTAVVLETDEAQNGFNGTEADLSLQAEAVPEVTAGRAASLEESDYKGFAGQIQTGFSERDIEALSRLCAYPVYVTTEANTEGQDVADAAALISQKDDIFTDAMLQAIAGVDPEELTPSQAGIFIGSESKSPGLFFSLTEDGQLNIMGINSEVIDQ